MNPQEQYRLKAAAAGRAIAQLVLRRRRETAAERPERARPPKAGFQDSSTTAAGTVKPEGFQTISG